MRGVLGCMIYIESKMPYIAMVFVQLVYAGMALFSKAAIAQGMNPYVFVVYRQAFATLALAPLAFFLERKTSAPLSCYLLCKIFLVSLCGITLTLNLYCAALNNTSATFAAAASNAIPAITFILAILFRMESISIKKWYGVAKIWGSILVISGTLVFAFVKGPAINFMKWYPAIHKGNLEINYGSKMDSVKGSLIMLTANTFWSLWLIMQAPIVKQYPVKLRLITIQCLFSCIQSAIWGIAVDRKLSSWKIGWDANLLSVAYCGVIVTGITYWLQLWTLEKRGPVFVAMFCPLALVITAIFSAFLWKEILYLGSICGAMLLVGGLYSFLWGKNKEEKSETTEQISESKEESV